MNTDKMDFDLAFQVFHPKNEVHPRLSAVIPNLKTLSWGARKKLLIVFATTSFSW